jgi:endonuclease-3
MTGKTAEARTRSAKPRAADARASLNAFLRRVHRRLPTEGLNPHGNQDDPLDELVFILLSAQTESYLYRRTYGALKAAFTPWDRLLKATEREVAEIIRDGGLARKKSRQLKSAFEKIVADRGRLSLQFLDDLSDTEVFRYLTSLPGIGGKSAKCVMMYSLGRAAFPVDTHVWRVLRRLGATPQIPKPTDQQQRELEAKIPKDVRYGLHVKLVSHGQQTCRTYFPKCTACSLSELCPSMGRTDTVWHSWRRPRGVWASPTTAVVDTARRQSA